MTQEDDDLPLLTEVLRSGGAPGVKVQPVSDYEARDDSEAADEEEFVVGTMPDAEAEPPSIIFMGMSAQAISPDTANAPEADAVPFEMEEVEEAAVVTEIAAVEPTFYEPASPLTAPIESAPAPTLFDADAMAARVRATVLESLSQRIDTELDARLAQTVTAQVETALAGLQASLRESLAGALRDVVRRAVDDEIARVSNQHTH